MGHDHSHSHSHADVDDTSAAAMDLSVPDSDLSPAQMTRRQVFRAAGVVGGAAALGMTGVTPAMAHDGPEMHNRRTDNTIEAWLAGDHHIHTQYSSDAIYAVADQAQHAKAYGLDWLVITDHGSVEHARIGVDLVNPDIVAAREELEDTYIFQGLEWNIPGAEHGTVFVQPGPNEVAVLKEFENNYDGRVRGATASTPANEALAVAGIQWLGQQVDQRRVRDALFLANHPARQGLDSPHEVRAWRDADPRIAVGWEGAPGHQAAALSEGAASGRGFYAAATPSANAFPGYPLESYRTWGGFDFYTSTVGGLWDSLLAEGKPWSISANSDSHSNYTFTSTRGPGSDFPTNGFYNDPVYAGQSDTAAGDYWPGFYSRTHVGARRASYAGIMAGIRDGKIWVDHGRLVKGLDMRVRRAGRTRGGTPLGGTLVTERPERLELSVKIELQNFPNWAGFVPKLNRVDLILGTIDVNGPADRDTQTAPNTRVVQSWDTSTYTSGVVELTYAFDADMTEPFYVRVRGTDANFSQPGYLGAAIDPAGPKLDVLGDADPWIDLWFYTNPIFVVPGHH